MLPRQLKRQNHYVPIWYQKDVCRGQKSDQEYLNFECPKTVLKDGRVFYGRDLRQLPATSCFKSEDLYTTTFGDKLNDEIETYFFGAIDNDGAKAVRAFCSGDHSAIHDSFLKFFEYLDIQKLRTPKGLDWIRSKFPELSQLELMLEMQALRQMHCTMWSECVREIVSAEDSEIKFIVTDHPVTVFNLALPPTSASCQYPNDPSIDLKGTQTVFVLDSKHCLILTNLEYAKNPNGVDLTEARTNARFRGQSLVRTDAFITGRKLSSSEVISINYLLKSRARQFIAASNKKWLYPENFPSANWEDIATTLLPNKEKLWKFGGETFVGYKDGTTFYQDEFGRSSPHEHLKKKKTLTPISFNDFCGCGSGRKFKKCCKDTPLEDRASWAVYSIRERNLILCRAVHDILDLNKGKTWDDVRANLSGLQVKRIHEVFSSLWPHGSDIAEILPRPDARTFRAVYLGTLDPRTVSANVIGWLVYFDEVVVPHPFINPALLKPEFSPTESPEKHKRQTLRNVLTLLALEPFIDAGLVHLVPDPSDLNDQLRRDVWSMAEGRVSKSEGVQVREGVWERLIKDDGERALRALPPEALDRLIKRTTPETSPEMTKLVVARMKEQHLHDPLALLQPLVPGEAGSQFLFVKGFNLEIGLFLAELTGSAIYTDIRLHWRHLHDHCDIDVEAETKSLWQPFKQQLHDTVLPWDSVPKIALRIRQSGGLTGMRQLFRRLNQSAQIEEKLLGTLARTFEIELAKLKATFNRDWKRFFGEDQHWEFGAHLEVSLPSAGFVRNSARRLAVTFGRAKRIQTTRLALFIQVNTPEPSGEESQHELVQS